MRTRTFDLKQRAQTFVEEGGLSDKHKILLKDAYLHPYEKYVKEEEAKHQLNSVLMKYVKKEIEEHAQQQNELLFMG